MSPLPQPVPGAPLPHHLNPMNTTREAVDRHLLRPEPQNSVTRQVGGYSKLHEPQRTKPVVWCVAIMCMVLSILLIFFGVVVLIIFVDIRPKTPVFDTPSASLTVVYINSPQFLNSDFTFVANFSNPNRKLDIRFEYVKFELYSFDTIISARNIVPFVQKRKQARLVPIQMTSSLVLLPPSHAIELQRQVLNNRVEYHLIGTYRVRINLGLAHYSYWLYSSCLLELTSPPAGVLVAHSCRTKR